MKQFKLFGLIMLLVMGMSAISSCSDDDDEPQSGTSIVGCWEHWTDDLLVFVDFDSDGDFWMEYDSRDFGTSSGGWTDGTYSYANGKLKIVSNDNDILESRTYSASMPDNDTLIIEGLTFIRDKEDGGNYD